MLTSDPSTSIATRLRMLFSHFLDFLAHKRPVRSMPPVAPPAMRDGSAQTIPSSRRRWMGHRR